MDNPVEKRELRKAHYNIQLVQLTGIFGNATVPVNYSYINLPKNSILLPYSFSISLGFHESSHLRRHVTVK